MRRLHPARRIAAQPRPYVDGPLASFFFENVSLAIAVICPGLLTQGRSPLAMMLSALSGF
jgi:hypothetical protein